MIKEISKYLIFGFFTTVISFLSFALMNKIVGTGIVVSNSVSWILAVSFAFVTNKFLVFQNKEQSSKKQVILFFLMRVVSLVIETVILLVLIDLLYCHNLIAKGISQCIIIVLNYIFSKFIVFK